MVFLRPGVTAALVSISLIGSALAFPLSEKLKSLSPGARGLLKRSVPAAPRFVAYDDSYVAFPPPSQLQGYSVYALSFWLTSGPVDMALEWQGFSASQRSEYLEEYNNAGISLVVAAFGSTEKPTSSGTNPVTVANNLASWVSDYGLQGVDVEYEDFAAFDSNPANAANWLISITQQLRETLPQGEYILTHAPVAPWFSPNLWNGRGYLYVESSVGSLIDWYNVQFYNQGPTEYTTCDGLLRESSSTWPSTALFEISNNGVSLDKLLIGKPATNSDAFSGYMSPQELASCVSEAHGSGWSAGVAGWQYPHATSTWIRSVRGNSF